MIKLQETKAGEALRAWQARETCKSVFGFHEYAYDFCVNCGAPGPGVRQEIEITFEMLREVFERWQKARAYEVLPVFVPSREYLRLSRELDRLRGHHA